MIEVNGLPPTKLSLAEYGEYKNKDPNDTEAGRSQNRRIKVVINNKVELS